MRLKHFIRQSEMNAAQAPLISDIDIGELLDKGLLALSREIHNLVIASAKGKLDAASARDLRDHIKLLSDLKDRENSLLKGLTKEQLEAALKDVTAPPGENNVQSE